jgi:hypothetical protein
MRPSFASALALTLAACTDQGLTFQPICTFGGSGGYDLACPFAATGVASPDDPLRFGMIADDPSLRDEDLVVKGSGACSGPTWTGWLTDRADALGIIETDPAAPTGHCELWVVRTRDQHEVARLSFDLRAPDRLTTAALSGATAIPAPAGYDQAWSIAAGTTPELDVEPVAGDEPVMGVPTLAYDDPDHVTAPVSGGSELFLVPEQKHGDHTIVVREPSAGLRERMLIRVP